MTTAMILGIILLIAIGLATFFLWRREPRREAKPLMEPGGKSLPPNTAKAR